MLPIVLVIIVTIVAIIALVSVGRALLNRGESNEAPEENPATRSLLVAEADRSVRMTVRGPIIADENFNSYQIEVSPIERRMTTYKGYRDEVIDTERLGNSMKGYEEFVYALNKANFTREEQLTGELDDIRGVCANGRLYTFEILQAQSVVKELWTSSCRDAAGSFRGNAVQSRDLFLKQIPESSAKIRSLNL